MYGYVRAQERPLDDVSQPPELWCLAPEPEWRDCSVPCHLPLDVYSISDDLRSRKLVEPV